MGWFESPQYLKNIQKIRAMGPEDKAVTQTLVDELAGLYAGADMQKQLQSMRIASDVKEGERAENLASKRLDLSGELGRRRLGMAERDIDYSEGANRTAEMLGWGNIGLSGLSGYLNMRDKKKQAARTQSLTDWIKSRS